jgi:organic radical activating enzyme
VNLRIFYLGTLRGCNYHCSYCPFADLQNDADQVGEDYANLVAFCSWVEQQRSDKMEILFTPRGDALIWPHYQKALPPLTHQPHIQQLVVQTNLSGPLEWLSQCDTQTMALWCTYHPEETSQVSFLDKLEQLERMQIPFSVGMVGKREAFKQIEQLRKSLPQRHYLWINAFKDIPDYYSDGDIARLTAIDPLFPDNLKDHLSYGMTCRSGDNAFTIDGDGTAYRCHLIKRPLGNIYQQPLSTMTSKRPCDRDRCDCYIGNINLIDLDMERRYGDRILARIPLENHWCTSS